MWFITILCYAVWFKLVQSQIILTPPHSSAYTTNYGLHREYLPVGYLGEFNGNKGQFNGNFDNFNGNQVHINGYQGQFNGNQGGFNGNRFRGQGLFTPNINGFSEVELLPPRFNTLLNGGGLFYPEPQGIVQQTRNSVSGISQQIQPPLVPYVSGNGFINSNSNGGHGGIRHGISLTYGADILGTNNGHEISHAVELHQPPPPIGINNFHNPYNNNIRNVNNKYTVAVVHSKGHYNYI